MKKLVVANWKMNPATKEEARELAGKIELAITAVRRGEVDTVICPPHPFLGVLQHLLHFTHLGAQNIAEELKGPFTGEVSALQVRSFGGEYAIIGHSERRALGEGDETISNKVATAVRSGLHPIICVGAGTKRGQSEAAVAKVVAKQLRAALRSAGKAQVTVAYEPVWAISRGFGTGKAVTASHAAKIIGQLRRFAPWARFIYGGSVDGKNAPAFAKETLIQGALVGGASLIPEEFLKIVKSFS